MSRLTSFGRRSSYMLILGVLLTFGATGRIAMAVTDCKLSTTDCDALIAPWVGWVPDDNATACGAAADGAAFTGSSADQTDVQKVATTFIVGLDGSKPKLAQAIATDFASKYHIGGTYLIGTSDGAGFNKDFYASLEKAAGGNPMVFASDEEGVVTRYDYGNTPFPSAAKLAKESPSDIEATVRKDSKIMADNGLTTDLAPVLDLRDVGDGAWANGRSFSSDPDTVAKAAGAFVEGLADNNVTPVFKHFPGFDDTTSGTTDDKYIEMKGSIDKTVAPYKKLLDKYPNAGVMLSNMYVDALDKNNPSSMSADTVRYLRNKLDFKGLITTDDLSVSSVKKKSGSLANAVSTALQAGVDMPLFQITGTSVAEAENNLDRVISTVQKNSAALKAIDDNQSIVAGFKGATSPTSQSSTTAGGCCSTTALSGDDNATKVYNYFIGKGLSPAAAAGIMGNMQAESHFNATAEQNPGAWEDLSTRNVNEGGKGGVGLVQWDGGRRPAVIKYMESQGLTDADFHHATDKLLGTELDYVWKELQGPYVDTLHAIQKETDAGQAAYDFHKGYEGSSDSPDQIKQNRMDPAETFFKQYSGSTSGGSSGAGCAGVSPNCTSAQGVAKILCAAKAYDTVSYSESAAGGHLPGGAAAWHKTCPVIGPSCVLDCSGLVNIAVYDAFKVELNENTDGERAAIGKYWKKISFSELQPGDLVQPNTGHVEIVDHVKGKNVYAFAAHTDGVPQPQQVGEWDNDPDVDGPNSLYLHYIGPGV